MSGFYDAMNELRQAGHNQALKAEADADMLRALQSVVPPEPGDKMQPSEDLMHLYRCAFGIVMAIESLRKEIQLDRALR
jgi:hypothetical protein